MKAILCIQEWDVSARLAQLNLDPELFQPIAESVYLAFCNRTENDAPTAAGLMAYFSAIRVLREQLVPRGWDRDDSGNQSKTCHAKTNMRIVVASGDEYTGRSGEQPSTRSSKGPKTRNAIEMNQRQMDIFPGHLADLTHLYDQDEYTTWVYLMHVSKVGVRAELSLPSYIDSSGQITTWAERILLPEYVPSTDFNTSGGTPDEDNGFDIPVIRKSREK